VIDRCHLCRCERGEDYRVAPDGLRWCADSVDCNFRARRRLGMPLHVCVESNELNAHCVRPRTQWTRAVCVPDRAQMDLAQPCAASIASRVFRNVGATRLETAGCPAPCDDPDWLRVWQERLS
jgi:hypothetical protein